MVRHSFHALAAIIMLGLAACSGATKGAGAGAGDMEAACKSYALPNNPDVTAPRLIHGGQPQAPASGSGFVCVRATISESGTVLDPVVIRTDNKDFAQAFLRALPDWRYEPATRGSARVAYHITLFARFPRG